ncbi:MAG: hypothetical protein V1801_00760 [Candidatus Falkowbacteria bacterium]
MAKFLYKIFLFEPFRRVENFVRNYWHQFLNFSLASDFLILFLEKEPRAERKNLNEKPDKQVRKIYKCLTKKPEIASLLPEARNDRKILDSRLRGNDKLFFIIPTHSNKLYK